MSNDTCLCMNLRAAAQQLTRNYDAVLAPAGISASQFSLLNYIRTLDKPSLKDLAAASGLDRSTLGRNLRVLEKTGLIEIHSGSDARTRAIALTRIGRKTLREATPLWQSVQNSLLSRLGDGKRDQLKALLAEITAEA